MLKAFSVPVTPQGKSALATLPPWHYSSDCMAIEYWADPGAIEASCRLARPRRRLPREAASVRASLHTGSGSQLPAFSSRNQSPILP